MRVFRRLFAALMILSVAFAPLGAIAPAAAVGAAKVDAVSQPSAHAGMADCHKPAAGPAIGEKTQQRKCDRCGDGLCASGACQLLCANMVADLPSVSAGHVPTSDRLIPAVMLADEPFGPEPQPPPPRS